MPLTLSETLALAGCLAVASARTMWSSLPATHHWRQSDGYLLKTAYPVGNGRLGAMPFGPPGAEKIVLNVDSLWAGGPFEIANYTGGNPNEPVYQALPGIRSRIFENGTGEMEELLGSNENYGSYRVLGNLTVDFDLASGFTEYIRDLDLKTGVHTTRFVSEGQHFETQTYCTYPDQVCVYSVSTDGDLPEIFISLGNKLVPDNTTERGCEHGQVRMRGVTQLGPPEGMRFDSVAAVSKQSRGRTSCSDDSTLTFSPAKETRSMTLVISAGTNFDQTKGNAEHDFSFRGKDPTRQVDTTIAQAKEKSPRRLLYRHLQDFRSLESQFSLDLADVHGTSEVETAEAIAGYDAEGPGDPFIEALLFDYSRYLLISSSRDGSLPANLQGRWSEELYPAWSADYHANINLQMNYWPADQTGLRETQGPLWEYMSLNWAPRGSETARLLYNASGWVVHNEMNVFGHTGMKSDAGWANYPAAPAWMMQHVWDYFDYTQDTTWLAKTGYPLIKGVAKFWLSSLQEDAFSNDGTLVVNPCNSPEHGPTTFGCAHYQQEIHQVFEAVLAAAPLVSEVDESFLDQVTSSLAKLDKGLDYTSWGGVKEWKLPESFGLETENRHRHLSHLTGWYPGYSISSFLGGYSDGEVQSAIKKTLIARGNGTADDADAGWAKVWRSACWSRLNSTDEAYAALRYAIDSNFVGNGFSMYSGQYEPFQIDANFGLGGAVLSMLVVDLPLPHVEGKGEEDGAIRTVVLGPAIPKTWAGGSVKGLRIRGGGVVDFSWGDDGLVTRASLRGSRTEVRLVNKKGTDL